MQCIDNALHQSTRAPAMVGTEFIVEEESVVQAIAIMAVLMKEKSEVITQDVQVHTITSNALLVVWYLFLGVIISFDRELCYVLLIVQ